MEKLILTLLIGFSSFCTLGQVGIGTTNPEGALDIVSSSTGLVVPRVTSIDTVTDGSGNAAVDGTIVYDLSKKKLCYRIDGSWICIGKDSSGNAILDVSNPVFTSLSNYIKASNTGSDDLFGYRVSLSGDGTRMAVAANLEDSNATGINGNESNNSRTDSGAVYIFLRTGTVWTQEAYIKASNAGVNDFFGSSISLSGDGTRLAVGSSEEDSNATGIGGDQTNNTASNSGAVYVFSRSGTTWTQETYLKASNTDSNDEFGFSVSLNSDGSRLAVGAPKEQSDATGINGNEASNLGNLSGAVYVFSRSGSTWTQETYIKASNTDPNDRFGQSVSLSADASRLAVSAPLESSNTSGINGEQNNNLRGNSGAVYIFSRTGTSWLQEVYIKSSNPGGTDTFGEALSLSGDGKHLVVGSEDEDSNTTGINPNSNNAAAASGAVYVFSRVGTIWTQDAFIKQSNTETLDRFGRSVSLNYNGTRLAVGARLEDSDAINVGGNQANNLASDSGAVYIFVRCGDVWVQEAYVKASNTESNDQFGFYVSLSADGLILATSANLEDSNATGIGGDETNNSASNSGAVFIVE